MISTECVPLSMRTPPPLIVGIRVPARRHVDARRERVFEEDDLAEDSRRDDALGTDDVVDVAELRPHGEATPLRFGGRHHPAGLPTSIANGFSHRTWIPHPEVHAISACVIGRRADHHGVEPALRQDPGSES